MDKPVTRVLVVDDERGVRDVLRSYLESAGFVVDTASNATQAVELFYANTYNLVTLDYRMPESNGANVHFLFSKGFGYGRKVSELLPQRLPPVLIVTGWAEDPQVLALLDGEHVVGIVQKPLRRDALVKAVHDILDREAASAHRHDVIATRLKPHLMQTGKTAS